MILPALVLGLGAFALVARSLRSALVDVLALDDVRFARAMGMSERQVIRRIALPNAVLPTLAVMGLAIGGLVSGTVLIENVFQLPGLGPADGHRVRAPRLPARARRDDRDGRDLLPAQPRRRRGLVPRRPACQRGVLEPSDTVRA